MVLDEYTGNSFLLISTRQLAESKTYSLVTLVHIKRQEEMDNVYRTWWTDPADYFDRHSFLVPISRAEAR